MLKALGVAGITPQRFHRLQTALRRRQPDLTVLLDGVHKAFNLSAVIRTCDAAGLFEAHSTAEHRPDELSQHHARGSEQWVIWRNHSTTLVAFERLRARGFQLVGADLSEESVDFRTVDYTRPTCFVMGSERRGLSPEARQNLDRKVTIPMYGLVGSLNVSVAAALLLYEAQKQRENAGLYEQCRLDEEVYRSLLFEWCYPLVAEFCRGEGLEYPPLGPRGEIPEKIHGRPLTSIRGLIRRRHHRAGKVRRGP